jgi:hypothetical protein
MESQDAVAGARVRGQASVMRTLDVISALSALGGLPSLVNTVKRCARFAIAWLRRGNRGSRL